MSRAFLDDLRRHIKAVFSETYTEVSELSEYSKDGIHRIRVQVGPNPHSLSVEFTLIKQQIDDHPSRIIVGIQEGINRMMAGMRF